MLYGRKLFDYHQAMKKKKELDNRLSKIEHEKNVAFQERSDLQMQINKMNEKEQTNEVIIERMLAEQKLYLFEKECVLKDETWMKEIFEVMQEQQDIEKKLKNLKSNIPDSIWEQYNKKKALYENPVAEVKHYMCTGCFIPLPNSLINKWRKGKDLVTCEVCDRILA